MPADNSITTAMLQDFCVTLEKCDPGVRKKTTTTVTSAQLRNDLLTGIQVAPAPGAGKIIIPLYCVVRYTYGVEAHSMGSPFIYWAPSTATTVYALGTALDSSSQTTLIRASGSSSVTLYSATVDFRNAALMLGSQFNSTAASATGTADIECHYIVGDG